MEEAGPTQTDIYKYLMLSPIQSSSAVRRAFEVSATTMSTLLTVKSFYLYVCLCENVCLCHRLFRLRYFLFCHRREIF